MLDARAEAATLGGMPVPDLLRRLPLKFTMLMVVVLYLAGEEYPFSPFPMYGDFAERAFYVYVSDAEGRPIATQKVFGQRASDVKKTFETHLRREKEALSKARGRSARLGELPPENVQKAAAATLRWLKSTGPNAPAPTQSERHQLHRVDLSLREGQIVSETGLLGEWP
ncbi:MAG: hypothetical protein ACR2OZ_14100 [Verrucomicrobiales bacterium]